MKTRLLIHNIYCAHLCRVKSIANHNIINNGIINVQLLLSLLCILYGNTFANYIMLSYIYEYYLLGGLYRLSCLLDFLLLMIVGIIPNISGEKEALIGRIRMAIHIGTALGRVTPSRLSNWHSSNGSQHITVNSRMTVMRTDKVCWRFWVFAFWVWTDFRTDTTLHATNP